MAMWEDNLNNEKPHKCDLRQIYTEFSFEIFTSRILYQFKPFWGTTNTHHHSVQIVTTLT